MCVTPVGVTERCTESNRITHTHHKRLAPRVSSNYSLPGKYHVDKEDAATTYLPYLIPLNDIYIYLLTNVRDERLALRGVLCRVLADVCEARPAVEGGRACVSAFVQL